MRRRLTAALFLGVAGYAMAGVFVVQGAPDLALTQAAVETLDGAVRAGAASPARPLRAAFHTATRSVRRVVAAVVGLTVFGFARRRGRAPPPDRRGDRRAIGARGPRPQRRNVILVDVRALDTLAEVTVLAAAVVGAVALARAGAGPAVRPDAERRPGGTGRHAFVDVAVRARVYIAFPVSVYLLAAGHNQPGGGFVGGLVAGAAAARRYLSGGLAEVRRIA